MRGHVDRALLALSEAELELYYAWVIDNRRTHFDSAITPFLQAVTDLQEAIKSGRWRQVDDHDDRLELYKLALKKVREAGYETTKDRVWDQYVSLAMRHCGTGYFLKKHDFEKYWQILEKEVTE